MEVVKLGKKGQVSIPRRLLRELGVEGEVMMIVEKTDEGGLLLKPAGIFPIETYSIERISEFLEEDKMSPQLEKRAKDALSGNKQ